MLDGRKNVFHITGINLGLVIEILLSDEAITPTYLERVIDTAREGMQLVALGGASPQPEGENEFFD